MKWWLQHIWKMIKKPGKGKRVFVGVSGGVDSSVSALLLKLYGYTVTGVFIRTWQPDWIECTWQEERKDAMRVCAHLEIPFIELNLEEEYKKGVADYMISEYRQGRTPNPDVMCNKEVKFGGFLDYAITEGANYIATGHYAQTDQVNLMKGLDIAKDQSYFLWTLTRKQLSHSMFPVGGFKKSFVRLLAQKYNIPIADKKDSQGICFIGEIDMKEFLGHYINSNQGNVLDETGQVMGTHNGVLLYTLGERHGFTIDKKNPNDSPYYVVQKDIPNNTITVSHKVESLHNSKEINLNQCVWRTEPQEDKKYLAQIRYHGNEYVCSIKKIAENNYCVIIETSEIVSPGQSIVVFDKNVCIGGGIVQ